MRPALLVLLVLAMGATLYVLVRGVIAMASGKDLTGEQSQKWMQRRVLFQAAAIVIVILILAVAGASSSS
jgi:Hypoxia induced protein conserved region